MTKKEELLERQVKALEKIAEQLKRQNDSNEIDYRNSPPG